MKRKGLILSAVAFLLWIVILVGTAKTAEYLGWPKATLIAAVIILFPCGAISLFWLCRAVDQATEPMYLCGDCEKLWPRGKMLSYSSSNGPVYRCPGCRSYNVKLHCFGPYPRATKLKE